MSAPSSKPHAFSLSRRAALTGFGGLAALPLLDAMFPGQARAAGGAYPLRFVVFFSSCGTIAANWAPTGGERDFQLSPILAPLEPFRDDIIVIQGVDQQGGSAGVGHQAGMGGMLTGNGLKDIETALSGITISTITVPADAVAAASALGL